MLDAPSIINRRYILRERIGAGGMGAVYRATDRLAPNPAAQTVALKKVTTLPQNLQFASRADNADLNLALAQEFKVLSSLRHPHIISVLDYGFTSNGTAHHQPFFTMELLENPRTILEASVNLPLAEKIRLLAQMLQALSYLHRRGIVHRDLKPSNVMVDGGNVKVLDFGLSMSGEQTETIKSTTAGTLAYMSPEVLQGGTATQASDLYAVGVIAYEMLSGRHPFDVSDMTKLITEVITMPVDLSALDLAPSLSLALTGLLSKTPETRYSDASDVIRLLGEVIDESITQETAATRESFLQAARLVGRDAELEQLSGALDQALNGAGSVWLVSGESGVGKSRLLDELRTLSLVKGATVLRGQGIAEGGSLYLLWRPVLRWLCLVTPLETAEASILKPLVPDIEELLERSIPDAPPEANPKAAQERLIGVIEKLFGSIKTQNAEPLVIILEDLHWASESVDLLAHLSDIASTLPLLLIGSYRDDEAPELANRVPAAPVLKLERLSAPEIATLSEAMLGSVGRDPQVIDLLQRETEGNVFFLVEVVRVLAEEAGSLQMIGQMTLPDHVFAGGMQRIVHRRLSRIPEAYYPLLQQASVLGRQLDLAVLEQLASKDTSFDLADWLSACADAAVLDVLEDRWRFAHDKLREGVLKAISEESSRALHEEAAKAIERVYPNDPEQVVILAYHWAAAKNDEKYHHYAALAGDQAMLQGANNQAVTYYTRALEALARLPETPDRQRIYIDSAIKLTRVSAYSARREGIKDLLTRALGAAKALGDEVREARVIANIGTFYYVSGRTSEAFPYFQQVIGLAEKLGLEELLLLPYNFIGRALMLSGDLIKAVPMIERGITLAEKFNDIDLLSGSEAFLASGLWTLGETTIAAEHAKRAVELAEKLGHPSRISGTLIILASGYCYRGEWDEALAAVSRALAIAHETGDLQPLYSGNAVLGYVEMHTGKLAEGIAHLDFSLHMAEKANLLLNLPLYQAWRADADLRNQNAQAALDRAEAAVTLAESAQQILARAEALRMASKAYLALGNTDEALRCIEQSLGINRQIDAQILTAKALYQLGKVYHTQAQRDKALSSLDEALALFERFGMNWYAEQVKETRQNL